MLVLQRVRNQARDVGIVVNDDDLAHGETAPFFLLIILFYNIFARKKRGFAVFMHILLFLIILRHEKFRKS
ncbi:MAG: hypothetical protein II621_04040, partial [Clostridia bacterium]|nr:hypothetical protein [Clostridia bacterium]